MESGSAWHRKERERALLSSDPLSHPKTMIWRVSWLIGIKDGPASAYGAFRPSKMPNAGATPRFAMLRVRCPWCKISFITPRSLTVHFEAKAGGNPKKTQSALLR